MDIHFTKAEKTISRLPLSFIYTQAKAVLKDRYNEHSMCTNRVSHCGDDWLFTVEEVSRLVEDIVDDTLYHQGRFC